jgi:glycine cleavage system H protein
MFPWVYGFTWTAGNIIFLGLFFTVAAVIGGTVTLAALRAYKDHTLKKHQAIQWHQDFHDLPDCARVCRHVITGELNERTCPNGFDCRVCTRHEELVAESQARVEAGEKLTLPQPAVATGFSLPLDRLYHRGHAWVRLEEDGTATVGVDDFCSRLFGIPDKVELPVVGTQLHVNTPGWKMFRGDSSIRVLAPIDGTVLETGGDEQGWYLKIQPLASIDTRHLLHGDEVRLWIAKEMDRLCTKLRGTGIAPTLADGGELVTDIPSSLPDADWDGIWGEMFLES